MTKIKTTPIAVLGAGSFGTSLAIMLAKNGNPTRLWGRNSEHIQNMQMKRSNQKYLADIKFPKDLTLFEDFDSCIEDVKDILVVTPSHAFEQTLMQIKKATESNTQLRIVWACKGLEPDTGNFLSEKADQIFDENIIKAILSGPTFAKELATGMPTAITLASNNSQFSADLTMRLVNQTFRVYLSEDLKGVQFGGAIKNIIAIGAGMADGLGFGANARTALITRGLAEMMRLGMKLGGRTETFTGMAGLGDLILTCTDNQSRNRRFGLAIGKGASIEQAAKDIGQVVEGVRNTKEMAKLANKLQIDMPICQSIYKVLYEKLPPKEAAKDLLTRAMKVEGD
ncbi:MAG: glycerol-3-phosphate dehydrogenase (NAD(P)+) [Polaribacter sp.]|jgi:glycerol-3-phosphate dehydrogenase (NAD(P)+)